MDSLNITNDTNDLFVDSSGNIAIATGSFALALNAACAIRTFSGECWFNSTLGIPYFASILGKNPPIEYLRSQLSTTGLNADPDIKSATVYFTRITDRKLSGQVQVSTSTGNVATSSF
jgi:hypothetical protein